MQALEKQKGYEIKNQLLNYPADWMVDKDVLEAAQASLPMILDFHRELGQGDLYNSPLKEMAIEHLPNKYSIPFLSKKYCEILLDEIKNLEAEGLFEGNPDEDELRQIPEVVLRYIAPEIEGSLLTLVQTLANPIFSSLWGRTVDGGNVQIAKYNVKNKKQGAWHHDRSADITMVVPLNTGDYVGGGTEFREGTIDPLPSGDALVFPSFTEIHKGLKVESGDRFLLVFWLTSGKENE